VAVSEGQAGVEPVVATETPFFHVDLLAAVRAAESGLDRVTKN